ncbi:hypothetical protein MTP99_015600 [Tenebrio molitor]|jgi:hypothetical protein|nr:hypothetical protein MTP99_015600 [Tenebrio molitor]
MTNWDNPFERSCSISDFALAPIAYTLCMSRTRGALIVFRYQPLRCTPDLSKYSEKKVDRLGRRFTSAAATPRSEYNGGVTASGAETGRGRTNCGFNCKKENFVT